MLLNIMKILLLLILLLFICIGLIVIYNTTQSNKIKKITGRDENYIDLLRRDYRRFLITLERLKFIRNQNPYEAQNILERWTLGLLNDNIDPWDSANNDAIELSKHTRKMREEMIDKHMSYPNFENAIKQIIEFNNISYDRSLDISYDNGVISYGIFKSEIPSERLDLLIEKSSLEETAACCMRYAALVPGSQQWAVPLDVYRALYKLGYTVEGFASPFNSQQLLLGGKFCSLFPEDKVFGSLGNFWNLNLSELDTGIIINSPFSEDILSRVARHVENDKKTKIIVVTPSWKDAEFYINLNMLTNPINLNPNEHYYEDTIHNIRRKIKARFGSSIFVLNDQENVDKISEYFKNNLTS